MFFSIIWLLNIMVPTLAKDWRCSNIMALLNLLSIVSLLLSPAWGRTILKIWKILSSNFLNHHKTFRHILYTNIFLTVDSFYFWHEYFVLHKQIEFGRNKSMQTHSPYKLVTCEIKYAHLLFLCRVCFTKFSE